MYHDRFPLLLGWYWWILMYCDINWLNLYWHKNVLRYVKVYMLIIVGFDQMELLNLMKYALMLYWFFDLGYYMCFGYVIIDRMWSNDMVYIEMVYRVNWSQVSYAEDIVMEYYIYG